MLSVAEYRRLHNMQVEDEAGGEPPAPVRTFDEAGFPPQLLQAVSWTDVWTHRQARWAAPAPTLPRHLSHTPAPPSTTTLP